VFQGALIPLLPSEFDEYLQAPVPYIIGVAKLPDDHESNGAQNRRLSARFGGMDSGSSIVFHLNEDRLRLSDGELESLPGYQTLHDNLSELWGRRTACVAKGQQRQLNKEVLEVFQRFHAWLIDEVILRYLDKDIITSGVFAGQPLQSMVDSMPQQFHGFMRQFLHGQIFSVFAPHLLKIAKEKKSVELDRILSSPKPSPRKKLLHRASSALEEFSQVLSAAIKKT
jgi:hypothetical protein